MLIPGPGQIQEDGEPAPGQCQASPPKFVPTIVFEFRGSNREDANKVFLQTGFCPFQEQGVLAKMKRMTTALSVHKNLAGIFGPPKKKKTAPPQFPADIFPAPSPLPPFLGDPPPPPGIFNKKPTPPLPYRPSPPDPPFPSPEQKK